MRPGERAATDARARALAARAREVFARRFGRAPDGVALAPGRVNLIGEHVDYAGGLVVPMAIDRAVAAAFGARADGRLAAWSDHHGQDGEDEVAALAPERRAGGWRDYPAAAAWVLRERGDVAAFGTDLALVADLPVGAGLSSSAALLVACLRALSARAGLAWDAAGAARDARAAETRFVGVPCGLMDPFASACGRAGAALLLDCRDASARVLALPAAAHVVVLDTAVERALVDGAYAERRAGCERVARAIAGDALPDGEPCHALRDAGLDDLAACAARLAPDDLRRARHVVEEIARARAFADALGAADLRAAGALMDASHASLRDVYEVSCPELDAAVALARALPGCTGARLTGAGFGGCAIALLERAPAPDALAHWTRAYRAQTGRDGQAFAVRAAEGARLVG